MLRKVTENELLTDLSPYTTAIHGFGFHGTLIECVDHVAEAYGIKPGVLNLVRDSQGNVSVRSRLNLLAYGTVRKCTPDPRQTHGGRD